MKKYGWQGNPIEVYEIHGKKIVLDGHHRLLAAKQVGITDIPIQLLNESELLSKWNVTPAALYEEYLSTLW